VSNPHVVAVNKFADMTNAEFADYYLSAKLPAKFPSNSTFKSHGSALPDSWTWVGKAVTPVKNLQQCGSCWAFSTTGSVEGCLAIATGQLVPLSEQNLVDCSGGQGNDGCNGGLMDNSFEYIIQNDGIDKESCYPYTAEDGTCHYNQACCGAQITGYTDVTSGSETDLQQAVYKTPVSVAIDASQSFQLYSSGVYYDPNCSSTQLDMALLVVGWGTLSGSDYWIVKNAWGTE
jgi:cathepsin L